MVIKIKNNKTNREYIFKYVKIRTQGYTNYTDFEIPGGNAEDNQSLPLGGSGVLFNITWSMKDDSFDVANGTHTSTIETPDEQFDYWLTQITSVSIDTTFTLTKGSNTYEVSMNDWDADEDPTDPEKNGCSVTLKLSKNLLS